ncbi:MAG: T9SS type A sorting domain-containing protein [Bacteroidetes bacterium]|nr:T9SS type A sorting domain-containing protein [Bacteroidota bacterium]
MKISYSLLTLALAYTIFSFSACNSNREGRMEAEGGDEEHETPYDGPAAMARQEFENTLDPKTGRVPRELLWPAIVYTDQLKQDLRTQFAFAKTTGTGWIERGPITDTTGPSNGNTRSGNGATSGRIRAVMVDKGDATGNTVFVGGVGGGLWKTTNITNNPAGWTLLDDKLSNLAITSICQDPKRPDTIYFCTGEANYNSDAVQGDGIFKSTDGGQTFSQLGSTTNASAGNNFAYCSRIVCDSSGNVYVGTRAGLFRSTNFGTSWSNITPSSMSPTGISDIRISDKGRMHIVSGFAYDTNIDYRYSDIPATATGASGWNAASSGFPSSSNAHAVLACQNDTLLILPGDNTNYEVANIYRSTNGGSTWAALSNTPTFTSGQGWYCLAAAIDPQNPLKYIVGSLDCYLTSNGGNTAWTQVSEWVGTTGNYVHADQQNMIWYHTATQSRILVVCDGGIFLSTDGGATFNDRNYGLRVKQFYSVAIHPSTTDYFIAGAQDNGCHQFKNAGLSYTTEITGGDGASVQIDQNQAQYQFGSYTYNNYRRSTNSGASWNSVNLSSAGRFINPTDYDNAANIMYCGNSAGTYKRWTNPQTGSTHSNVTVSGFGGSSVYAIAVSPYTSNTVYFGLASGRIVRVPSANTTSTSSTAGVNLGTLNTQVSSIVFGGSEDTILVTSTNYVGTQVYYTTNGTSSSPTWVGKDGNLPNIPVRSALLLPGTSSKRAMIATETGVWVTKDITASAPTWLPDPTFPNVSTYMLRYRASDSLVAAATHGRGLWTANVNTATGIALPINNFVLQGNAGTQTNSLSWTFSTHRSNITFEVQRSADGEHYAAIAQFQAKEGAQNFRFTDNNPRAKNLYRIKSTDAYGLVQYSNFIQLQNKNIKYVEVGAPYPNPTLGKLTLPLQLKGNSQIQIQVFGINGQKVWDNGSKTLDQNTPSISLELAQLTPGNYTLVAIVDNKRYSFKIQKQ